MKPQLNTENNDNLSLVYLMRDDSFIKRMEDKKKEVKKHIDDLSTAAKKYSKKYEDIVEQGTKEKQLLLEDGHTRGLKDEDILGKLTKFIPAKDTPILNMLYFLLNEYKNQESAVQFLREQKDLGKNYELLRESMDKEYGHLTEADAKEVIPDLLGFVYDNVTLDIFNTIKKLKALSNSPVESEAFRAYTKCKELCKRYNLDFDRIPCDIEAETNKGK